MYLLQIYLIMIFVIYGFYLKISNLCVLKKLYPDKKKKLKGTSFKKVTLKGIFRDSLNK